MLPLSRETFMRQRKKGIYRISTGSEANPQNTGEWKLLGSDDGFSEDYSSDAIVTYNNQLYIDVNDTLYNYVNGVLEFVHFEEDFEIIYITAEGAHMLVGQYCRVNGIRLRRKGFIF